MAHSTFIKVRGYHLDLYQHVNNARYLEFLEEARWQFFDDANLMEVFMTSGMGLAVVNININYRRGALMNDELQIQTSFESIGQRSAAIKQVIYLKGTDKVVADADITFVVVDPKQNKAVTLEGPLAIALAKLVEEGQA